jgi:hypothetical protein
MVGAAGDFDTVILGLTRDGESYSGRLPVMHGRGERCVSAPTLVCVATERTAPCDGARLALTAQPRSLRGAGRARRRFGVRGRR